MNKLLLLCLVLLSSTAFGQFGISGIGIGFTGYATTNMKSKSLSDQFLLESVGGREPLDQNIYHSRALTAYSLVLSSPDKSFFALELDLLQGTEDIYSSKHNWRNNQDSNISESVTYDINGANLGLRSMFKLRTDPSRRFHYNFGIGLEAIYTYGLTIDGNYHYDVSHWPSSYFYSETENFGNDALENYMSYNVIQQVGAAFRLGKDDTTYPLNRTYVELNFHILSNFSTIAEDLSTFRSYGGSLRLIYEIK